MRAAGARPCAGAALCGDGLGRRARRGGETVCRHVAHTRATQGAVERGERDVGGVRDRHRPDIAHVGGELGEGVRVKSASHDTDDA